MTWLRAIEARSLRHLERVAVDLSPTDGAPRAHLVLLGPNASGKTTLLAEIASELEAALEGRVHPASEVLEDGDEDARERAVRMSHLGRPVRLTWSAPAPQVTEAWRSGRMIALHLRAVRAWDLSPVELGRFDTEPCGPEARLSRGLSGLLVARNAAVRSADGGQSAAAHHAELFLVEAERALRRILGLEARLSLAKHEAHLDLPDGRRLRFDQLSRGHVAAIGLWAEIFMRVEAARLRAEAPALNPSGVVVIDAPEADLDARLQRQLLPLLAELFESLQFVVSTHSPLVAMSLEDSVVFDLARGEARDGASVRRGGLDRLLARMMSDGDTEPSSLPSAPRTGHSDRPPRMRRPPARLGKSAEMKRPEVAAAISPTREAIAQLTQTRDGPLAPPSSSIVPLRPSTTPPPKKPVSIPPPAVLPSKRPLAKTTIPSPPPEAARSREAKRPRQRTIEGTGPWEEER